MNKLLTLLIAFLFVGQLSAQQTVPTEAISEKLENSLLWEITGNDLASPSYLYGTIHMIGKDDFFLNEPTKSAFKDSERVTFEINMEEMNDMSILFSLISKVMMEDGKRLKDLMNETDYALVKKHFEEAGLPLFLLERVKPMFLSTFASGDMEANPMGSGDVVSYEMEFMTMAQEEEMEMAGLETIEFQMTMFDSIPYEVQADMLVESLKTDSTGGDQFADMVELYKAQDLAGMQAMFDTDEGGLGDYDELLLINRNKNWIPIMEKMMTEKKTFFAVGAGHLGGDLGVISLLRRAGYTMKPLKG